MYKATERQVGICMFISILSLKLLIYPALVARYAQNNAYLSVVLSFMIEMFFTIVMISAMKKNPDKTIKDIMESVFGKIFSRFIFLLLFLYFIAKAVLAMKECHNFFFVLLYDQLDWYYFIIPILTLAWFVLNKSVKSYSRSIELCWVVIVLGTITSIFMSITKVEIDNFLPFLQNGFAPVANATITTNFGFGDYLILVLFAGNIKYENKSTRKIYKYIIIADLVVIFFHTVFVGIFGDVSVMQSLAVSDLPLQSQVPLDDGRLEWLNIIVWTVTLILQILLMLLCSKCMLKNIFTVKNENIYNAIIIVIIIACMYGLYFSLAQGVKIIISPYFFISSVIIQALVPSLYWIASTIFKNKQKSVYSKTRQKKVEA